MSRIPQPLVLATKVALECLLDRQKWRRSTVQRLRKPGMNGPSTGWLGSSLDFCASEELWKIPLQSFYDAFCGKHLKTCDHFIPSPWFVSLGLDKLLHPTKTTYRPCDDAQKAPKHQRHWPLQTKKPTCTSQKVTAGFPEKMMWDFCQVRLVHPQKFQGKVQLQPFPHFQVNEPFVFGEGVEPSASKKSGVFGHLKRLSQSIITIYWFLGIFLR